MEFNGAEGDEVHDSIQENLDPYFDSHLEYCDSDYDIVGADAVGGASGVMDFDEEVYDINYDSDATSDIDIDASFIDLCQGF